MIRRLKIHEDMLRLLGNGNLVCFAKGHTEQFDTNLFLVSTILKERILQTTCNGSMTKMFVSDQGHGRGFERDL